MLHTFLLTLSLAAAHPQAQDAYEPVREKCRDLLYVSRLLAAKLSRVDDAEKLRRWKASSERYLEQKPKDAWFEVMYDAYWSLVFERAVRAQGIWQGIMPNPEHPGGKPFVEVNREALIVRHPALEPYLPPDYRLIFFPTLQVAEQVDAFVAASDQNIIGLPLNLAWGEFSDEDLIRLQHEAGHVQRRRDRAAREDYTLSFEFDGDAKVESEEILAYTLTSVAYLKASCANSEDVKAREKAGQTLTHAYLELKSYTEVLPKVGDALRGPKPLEFTPDGRWQIAGFYVRLPHPQPRWQLPRARRWLDREIARVVGFEREYDRFLDRHFHVEGNALKINTGPELCADIGRLERLLGTLAPLAR